MYIDMDVYLCFYKCVHMYAYIGRYVYMYTKILAIYFLEIVSSKVQANLPLTFTGFSRP